MALPAGVPLAPADVVVAGALPLVFGRSAVLGRFAVALPPGFSGLVDAPCLLIDAPSAVEIFLPVSSRLVRDEGLPVVARALAAEFVLPQMFPVLAAGAVAPWSCAGLVGVRVVVDVAAWGSGSW